jgi:hypothetical protein
MPPDAELAHEDPEEAPTLVPLPGEFYYEGPYLVFTEAYHLRRGYCCRSGCRHCPYGFVKPGADANANS